jgi:four helix bundle protein
MMIRSFRDLEVWQLSMQLAEDIYQLVRQFPADERFALSIQLRKAGISIPSNIAEGSGYGTNRRYVHHLRVACGSDSEVQTQLELAERLGLAKPTDVRPVLERASRIGRMLNGLIRSLDRHHRHDGL